MNKLLAVLLAAAFAGPALAEDPAVAKTTKTVCKDVIGKDGKPSKNKDGSVRQACKVIKIHKKHEGTEIPPKK